MEVMVAAPLADFNFESACSSPYMSAPPSPRGFGDLFFSAPTSPSRASAIYREFNLNFNDGASDDPPTPFDSEFRDAHLARDEDEDEDFDFEFSGPLDRNQISLSAAEDLFDGGKIRPLNSKPFGPVSPPRPSPRKRNGWNSSGSEIEGTRKERGRERAIGLYSSSNSSRRGSRSLSPLRVSELHWQNEQHHHQEEEEQSISRTPKSSDSKSSSSSSKGYRKWRLKDFLLFRSASEGRATEKDPLRKYTALWKKGEDLKNSSFRSIDSTASTSSSTRRGRVSAHELHYTANRAVAEELKKKTFLPYKRGLLGCLAFNHTANEIARGLKSANR